MPLLVWCMGASDYDYSLEILESILQIVSDLAWVEYHDFLNVFQVIDPYKLWKKADLLIKVILIRGFYRGMAGDVKMLNGFAWIWHKRLKNQKWKSIIIEVYKDSPLFKPEDLIEEYKIEDALIEGIDFHCSNMIENLLKNKDLIEILKENLIVDHEKYLRDNIWSQRSAVNLRKHIFEFVNDESLCEKFVKQDKPTDPVFQAFVLPFVDAFSNLELTKRFNIYKNKKIII